MKKSRRVQVRYHAHVYFFPFLSFSLSLFISALPALTRLRARLHWLACLASSLGRKADGRQHMTSGAQSRRTAPFAPHRVSYLVWEVAAMRVPNGLEKNRYIHTIWKSRGRVRPSRTVLRLRLFTCARPGSFQRGISGASLGQRRPPSPPFETLRGPCLFTV